MKRSLKTKTRRESLSFFLTGGFAFLNLVVFQAPAILK
jgi:hypothetical protein